jgi:hypothetical protein
MRFGVIWGPKSHSYTNYDDVRNGAPSACRDACTCLNNFPNTCGNSEWGMFLMNAGYVQSAIWLAFTLHTNPAAFTPLQDPCLWNESHIALNHASLGLSLEVTPRNSTSLYQHTQHFSWQQNTRYNICTDWWKIRAHHSHIIQTSSGDKTFPFAAATWFDSGCKSAGGWGTSLL